MSGRVRLLQCKKGSSSILLVVIMVALLSLGILSVVSAFSNYRIAQKNANWNVSYYEKDGIFQNKLFEIDRLRLQTMLAPLPQEALDAAEAVYGPGWQSGGSIGRMEEVKRTYAAALVLELLEKPVPLEVLLKMDEAKRAEACTLALMSNPEKEGERTLSMVVGVYGNTTSIMEYREVPASFTYTDMEFTNIGE